MTTFFDETFGFFANKTSLHGVKNMVYAEHKPMRILWGVIVIVAVSIAVKNGKLRKCMDTTLSFPPTLVAHSCTLGVRFLKAMKKSFIAMTIFLNVNHFLSLTSSVLSMTISFQKLGVSQLDLHLAFSGIEVTYSYIVEGTNTTKISYTTHSEGGLPIPMITICPTRNPFLASRLKGRALLMDDHNLPHQESLSCIKTER